jgi:hypothetical protein
MKYAIIVPVSSEESITSECKESLNKLKDIDIHIEKGIDCGRNINTVLKKYKNCYDKFLIIDSDIAFNPEDVEKIFMKTNLVACGVYEKNCFTRLNENNNSFVAGEWDDKYIGLNKYWLPNENQGVVRVSWSGNGFLMIDNRVLDIIDYPYFQYPIIQVDDEGNRDYCMHDIGFCLNCYNHNVDIYCDTSLKVKHCIR